MVMLKATALELWLTCQDYIIPVLFSYGDIESYYSWVASEFVTAIWMSACNSIINR